jgi:hypothetical protein
MALKNVLAFIAVRDIEAGIRWYKMLLGREPDTQPMKRLAEMAIRSRRLAASTKTSS